MPRSGARRPERSDQSAEGAGRPSSAAGLGALPRIVRSVAADGRGWSGITWSDLDEQLRGRQSSPTRSATSASWASKFEWKLYDYDQPADLAARLLAAGFTPEDEETLMVAAVPDVPAAVGAAGRGTAAAGDRRGGRRAAHRRPRPGLRRRPLAAAQIAAGPARDRARDSWRWSWPWPATEPVCSARIEFLPGTDFASLWGGGTLPAWRRKGIYRALVAYRAGLAAARGYRFLQVDASADSRPVLQHLGFVALARTTPYVWSPVTAA